MAKKKVKEVQEIRTMAVICLHPVWIKIVMKFGTLTTWSQRAYLVELAVREARSGLVGERGSGTFTSDFAGFISGEWTIMDQGWDTGGQSTKEDTR